MKLNKNTSLFPPQILTIGDLNFLQIEKFLFMALLAFCRMRSPINTYYYLVMHYHHHHHHRIIIIIINACSANVTDAKH